MIAFLFVAQVATERLPACHAYHEAVDEVGQLGPSYVRLRPGETVAISAQGRGLIDVRERMAIAMKQDNPSLDRIEQLMREELRLRAAVGTTLAERDLACKMARLRSAGPEERRRALDILRPVTAAERAERHALPVSPPVMPTPPPPPASPPPR